MKIYTFINPKCDEYLPFSTMDNLRQYVNHWHLGKVATEILIDTGIYRHDNLGAMRVEVSDINPYFDGNRYE